METACAGLKVKTITGIRNITNEILTLKNSRITLKQDEILPGQLCLEDSYLDCNGHTLTAKKGFTQADTMVNLNRGALQSGSDYCIMGSSILQMIRPEDRVRVKRNFIMASTMNHSTMLRDGRMEVGGDFNQNGDLCSFASSENFVIAFTGEGVHKAHFLDTDYSDFANVDPVLNNYEKSEDAISATTAIYCFAEGFVKGLEEALNIPVLAATTLAVMAAYGLGAALGPASVVTFFIEGFSLLMFLSSVFMMFDVCEEVGDTLDSDMTTEQKAKEFGRMGALMLLSAVAMSGSLALLSNPVKVQTTLEQTKEMIWLGIKDFRQAAKLITVESVETLIAYVKEFAEEDALAFLKEAASGKDIRQLHKLGKLVRDASKEVGRALRKDELEVAVKNWNKTGSIKEAIQAVKDWIEIGFNKGPEYIKNQFKEYIRNIRDKLPNHKLRKEGNVAVADVDIPGVKNKFVAHSNIDGGLDKGADVADFSYLKSAGERKFNSYVEDSYPRHQDSEAKILEDVASRILESDVSGTIELYSEYQCCESCTKIILEFKRMFPNIKLNVYVE